MPPPGTLPKLPAVGSAHRPCWRRRRGPGDRRARLPAHRHRAICLGSASALGARLSTPRLRHIEPGRQRRTRRGKVAPGAASSHPSVRLPRCLRRQVEAASRSFAGGHIARGQGRSGAATRQAPEPEPHPVGRAHQARRAASWAVELLWDELLKDTDMESIPRRRAGSDPREVRDALRSSRSSLGKYLAGISTPRLFARAGPNAEE